MPVGTGTVGPGLSAPPVIGSLTKQTDSGASGLVLANSTGTLIQWTTPNDGNLHTFEVNGTVVNSGTNATGGQVTVVWVIAGQSQTAVLVAANTAGGSVTNGTVSGVADPNTHVVIRQNTALSAGGPASLYGSILGA